MQFLIKYKLLWCLALFLPGAVTAESFTCEADLTRYGRPGQTEIKIYQREGGRFIRKSTQKSGSTYMNVVFESDTDIVLMEPIQERKQLYLFITMLNKFSDEYYETYFSVSNGKNPESNLPIWGKCMMHK
jgi:hypothetical protein